MRSKFCYILAKAEKPISGLSAKKLRCFIIDILNLQKNAPPALKNNGAKIISLTNYGKSPIVKQSDCILPTASDETQYSILDLSSRIAQLAIVDALYYYVLCQNPHTHDSIKSTEKALHSKKY